jgi:putative restriction endonuclease
MSSGVFIHRSGLIYKDSPAERYQFPPQYLRRVQACVGDWIIYYEPVKVPGTRGYFAVARVKQVIPAPGTPGMYLAIIEPGSCLDFATRCRSAGQAGLWSADCQMSRARSPGGRSRRCGRSRQSIQSVVSLGLAKDANLLPRVG